MLQRGQLLPSGAFEVPNPNIPFAELGLAVVEEFQEWPAVVGRPRRAGVSSFGFGGTNAHVIVEQAVERVVEVGPGVLAWVVSARTAAGVPNLDGGA